MSISELVATRRAEQAVSRTSYSGMPSTPEWRTRLPWLKRSKKPRDFHLDDLQPHGWSKWLQWIFDEPYWLFWLIRTFYPIPKFFGWAFVSRYDDVQEVLKQDRIFHVPFGPKVRKLSDFPHDGPNFLLGMQRSPDYWHMQRQVMQAFQLEDVEDTVTPCAKELSEAIIAGAKPTNGNKRTLDAIEGLITLVPIRMCNAYYGVRIPQELETDFGRWTIAMSLYTFGNPLDNPRYERAAVAASKEVHSLIDAAIRQAKKEPSSRNTVLHRLLRMQKATPSLDDMVIRSFFIGMMTGFVPTNTMAAGNMLVMLLRWPNFMEAAQDAARADDDERLTRCLFEAMRFKPLNPGPFRICAEDYTVAAGTWRGKTIKRGTKLLAGTESAMFDSRRVARPWTFNPERPSTDYMLFGHGLHWCIGAYIAQAQITQTFKALLVKDGLQRVRGKAGKLKRLGPFPWHLTVEFDA